MTDEDDDQEQIDEYKFSIDQVSNQQHRQSHKSTLPHSDSMK